MRQNPIISSRVQVGGRPMPTWFSASLINQARSSASTPPPPPLPAEPPPADESEYEEIDHLPRYTNMNMKKSPGAKRSCSLCGNSNPVVRCEMCSNQIFCGSCNDMYHRHPKRHNHVRKLLESLDNNRPPLPPKSFTPETPVINQSHGMMHSHSHSQLPPMQIQHPQLQQHQQKLPGMIPVPPPRRHKRFGMRSATTSPTTTRKVFFDPMGSLKRFVGGMGQRPLPPPPKSGPPLPPKSGDTSRPMTPIPMGTRGTSATMVDRRHSSPLSAGPQHPRQQRQTSNPGRNIPLTVLEMQNARNQSVSIANLSDKHTSSRDSGYPDWEEDDDDFFSRQRANSISTSQLHRYPASSSNPSHFATLQRPGRNQNPPQRPPPPVPPRHFTSQLSFQSSQSVFDLDRMSAAPHFGMPWMHPGAGYPFDFQQNQQQAAMMGYPGMQRTPSSSSMGGGQPPFFGWGPVGFGQPMSQKEMEFEIMAARRGSEPPPYGNAESMSQPVTPQGSFRKKSSRQHSVDRMQGIDRSKNLSQGQLQRPPTPNFPRTNSNSKPSRMHQESEEDSYFSSDRKGLVSESDSLDESKIETTENPEGPWTCEHCTFINPKSSKVCTVCCKTPSDGYRVVRTGGNNRDKSRTRRSVSRIKDQQAQKEEAPVVKSKLSFSRSGEKQQTVNLSVEQIKKAPTPQRQTTPAFDRQLDSDNDENDERESQHQQHHKFSNKSYSKNRHSKTLSDSNEDVYGSVPLQTLTITPKIEIRRPTKTSTGVGSSPPRFEDTGVGGSPPPSVQPTVSTSPNKFKNKINQSQSSGKSKSSDSNDNLVDGNSNAASFSSPITTVKATISTSAATSPIKSMSVSASTSTSTSSQGMQTSASSSSGSTGNSSNSYSTSSSTSPFLARKDLETENKSSKGTSPPPQSISTQTYEDVPAYKMRQKSVSKTSIQSEESSPPKVIEMSEKALRYARKAQNQHQSKLKRSMSTHLTSASSADPWADTTDSRHLYRSSSRHSLASDTRSLPLSGPPSRDPSPPRGGRFYEDFHRFPPPSWDRFPNPGDYFASIEDLVSRKRRESIRSQEFELTRLLKEAEEFNYTPEDVQVALRMCGERNPIKWLQENWSNMIETVQTLATKYGREKGQDNNEIGTISSAEAKEALRVHRGNVWAAVTECVEHRRKKFLELQSRGTFLREDILTALTANHGNMDAAYVELSKAQLKPFLMRIWGPPSGLDNDALPPSPSVKSLDMEPFLPTVSINSLLDLIEKPYSSEQLPIQKQASKADVKENSPEKEEDGEEDEEEEEEEEEDEEESEEEIEDYEEEEEIGTLEPEPRLERLVSDAERVTMEIERAIQELKSSAVELTIKESSIHAIQAKLELSPTAPTQIIEKLEPLETKVLEPIVVMADTEKAGTQVIPMRQMSESESEIETAAQHVKSDGEDESFADAISDTDLNAEQQNLITAASLSPDPEVGIGLEVEIDESEAHVSDFIQNFEIDPPKPVLPEKPTVSSTKERKEEGSQIVQEDPQHKQQYQYQSKQEESNASSKEIESSKRVLSSSEIEQILSSLTTFTEMGQFATNIKEKIATEIQQQLAAAATLAATSAQSASTISKGKQIESQELEAVIKVDNETEGTVENNLHQNQPQQESSSSLNDALDNTDELVEAVEANSETDGNQEDDDKIYEPITLPQAVYDNVTKKMAKYERAAAKKKEKALRRKSPENSAVKAGSSGSPSPSTSLSHLSLSHESPTTSASSVPANPSMTINEPKHQPETLSSDSVTASDVNINNVDKTVTLTMNQTSHIQTAAGPEEEEEESFSEYEEVELSKSFEENISGKSDSVTGSEELGVRTAAEDTLPREINEEQDQSESISEDDEMEINGDEIYEEVDLSHSSDLNNKVLVTQPSSTLSLDSAVKPVETKEHTELQGGKRTPIKPEHEAQIKRLMGEGLSQTYDRAELAVQLMDMDFAEEDSVYAANECASLYSALSFLQQECDLCAGKFSAKQMVSMLRCTHWCCRNCAQNYFKVQVRDKSIIDCTCPFCQEPTSLNEETESATEYFNHLDILLKNLLDAHHHEMFQRKLRDWTLAKTPNFKWCSKCSSGFITEPLQTRLVCPDCSAVTCAICLEPWDKIHHYHRDSTILLCDVIQASKSIVDYLDENCIECPKCHFRFALARGGCMHLTCTQCRHEFCSGCAAPFRMGTKCEAKFPICDKLGLHAHHPRNCLFYLRDKEPEALAKLLEENSIPYLKESVTPDATEPIIPAKPRKCQVAIQRETGDGLQDGICGKTAPRGYATVCLAHYVEYLGLLIWQNHLDPVSILISDDLETIIRRAHKKLPGSQYRKNEADHREKLLKVITDEIPL